MITKKPDRTPAPTMRPQAPNGSGIRVPGSDATFTKLALPTALQSEALRLIGLEPRI